MSIYDQSERFCLSGEGEEHHHAFAALRSALHHTKEVPAYTIENTPAWLRGRLTKTKRMRALEEWLHCYKIEDRETLGYIFAQVGAEELLSVVTWTDENDGLMTSRAYENALKHSLDGVFTLRLGATVLASFPAHEWHRMLALARSEPSTLPPYLDGYPLREVAMMMLKRETRREGA